MPDRQITVISEIIKKAIILLAICMALLMLNHNPLFSPGKFEAQSVACSNGIFYWDNSTECNITSARTCENATIYAQCDIVVSSSTLTFTNVTFKMNQTADYTYDFIVKDDASLIANESTEFTYENAAGDRYDMIIAGNLTCDTCSVTRPNLKFVNSTKSILSSATIDIVYTATSIDNSADLTLKDTYCRYFWIYIRNDGAKINELWADKYFTNENAITSTYGLHLNCSNCKVSKDGADMYLYAGNTIINNTCIDEIIYKSDDVNATAYNTTLRNQISFSYVCNNNITFGLTGTSASNYVPDIDFRCSGGTSYLGGYYGSGTSITWIYSSGFLKRYFPICAYSDAGITNIGSGNNISIYRGTEYITSATTDSNGCVNLGVLFNKTNYNENCTIKVNGTAYKSNLTLFSDTNETDASGATKGIVLQNVVLGNAPIISSLTLLPSTIYTNTSPVNCTFSVSDPNGDNIDVNATFYNGSNLIKKCVWTNQISGTSFNCFMTNTTLWAKDDVLYCNVTATDGTDTTTDSVTKTVSDSPSSISVSLIYPTGNINVTQNHWFNVTVKWNCTDADGDSCNITEYLDPTLSILSHWDKGGIYNIQVKDNYLYVASGWQVGIYDLSTQSLFCLLYTSPSPRD